MKKKWQYNKSFDWFLKEKNNAIFTITIHLKNPSDNIELNQSYKTSSLNLHAKIRIWITMLLITKLKPKWSVEIFDAFLTLIGWGMGWIFSSFSHNLKLNLVLKSKQHDQLTKLGNFKELIAFYFHFCFYLGFAWEIIQYVPKEASFSMFYRY